MNSDSSTETIFPGNLSWPHTITKNLVRDVPTTSTAYAVDIGSWNLSNGAALFEISIQVNTSGFTVSKYYKFSVVNNSTSASWLLVSPEVDSGASSSNNFALELNVNGSTCSMRIHRTGGSTAGEAKISITKFGSLDDVFTSSNTSSNVGAVSSTTYSRSYGVNYVLLSESNTFTAPQTINSRLIAKGDGVTYPAIRFGGGSGALSTNQSLDGSIILQGTTALGTRSQFEIIAPNSGSRIVMEAHNTDGVSILPMGSNLKFNQNSGSFVIGGTNSSNGLSFSSGISSGINPDISFIRVSSGNLKLNDSSSYGNLFLGKIRLNSLDTSKTQMIYGSGQFCFIENSVGYPSFVTNLTSGYAGAFTAGKSGTTISYDQSGPFSIISQTNSAVKNNPGSGTFSPRLIINTNGDIAIGHSTPTQKLDVAGTVKATAFNGDGSSITNLSSTALVGTIPTGLLPLPTTTTLGGVKRNIGSSGSYVTGVSPNGDLLYSPVQSRSTKTLSVFKPLDWETDSLTYVPETGVRNKRRVLKFEQTYNRYAMWSDIIKEGTLMSNGIDVYAWWSSDVTVGTVGWLISIEKVSNGSTIDGDNFSSAVQIAASNVPAAGNIKMTTANLPNYVLSGLAAGDMFRFKIGRDVAADNAAGYAELHMVELRETL
jgi:hypothetical protein